MARPPMTDASPERVTGSYGRAARLHGAGRGAPNNLVPQSLVLSQSPTTRQKGTTQAGSRRQQTTAGHSEDVRRSNAARDPYDLSELEDDVQGSHRSPRKRKYPPGSLERNKSEVKKANKSPYIPARSVAPVKPSGVPASEPARIGGAALLNSDTPRSPEIPTHQRPQRQRRRLIDALVAQKQPDLNVDPVDGDELVVHNEQEAPITGAVEQLKTPKPSKVEMDRSTMAFSPREDASKRSAKIKVTYSQSRTIAKESLPTHSTAENAIGDSKSGTLLSSPISKKEQDSFHLISESEGEEGRPSAIKSVHELRRAGANNRFSDELEDLLSRIGKPKQPPSSLRRNALLELFEKLRHQSFASQFRDHTDRDGIVHRIGQEHDIISAFALFAVLTSFLSDRPAPNLLQRLATEGIGELASRMLYYTEDIDTIASQRESNLAKHSRSSLKRMKGHMLKTDIWLGRELAGLSPRTLSLQLLDILYRISDLDSLRRIGAECYPGFASLAGRHVECVGSIGADFDFMVTIMEAQCNVARASGQEDMWLRQHSSNAAYAVRNSLEVWSSAHLRVRSAALRMAINVTNTVDGSLAFHDSKMVSDLSLRIIGGINAVQQAVDQHRVDNDKYELLILTLGVVINILEHCPSARDSVQVSSIHGLTKLHEDHHLSMSEADSEEKSRFSVLLGYLAVLIGYLCLSATGLSVVRSELGGVGLRRLLGSIRGFIDIYKNVDSRVHGLEGLVSELQTRLF